VKNLTAKHKLSHNLSRSETLLASLK